jgi:hypothetical protein
VALFSVSLVSSLLTTGFRAIRQRNGVAFILSCAPLALAVVVLLVGLTDLDQLGIVPGYYPFWDAEWGIFGRLLMFQSGTVVTGSASALHANVMGALSWLTVMVGARRPTSCVPSGRVARHGGDGVRDVRVVGRTRRLGHRGHRSCNGSCPGLLYWWLANGLVQ